MLVSCSKLASVNELSTSRLKAAQSALLYDHVALSFGGNGGVAQEGFQKLGGDDRIRYLVPYTNLAYQFTLHGGQ